MWCELSSGVFPWRRKSPGSCPAASEKRRLSQQAVAGRQGGDQVLNYSRCSSCSRHGHGQPARRVVPARPVSKSNLLTLSTPPLSAQLAKLGHSEAAAGAQRASG